MNKSVLISIQPQWCRLIACGAKTIEVRKTAPTIKPPFKCYIYQTMGKKNDSFSRNVQRYFDCGKVIGEFTCDRITTIHCWRDINASDIYEAPTCLTRGEICEYLNFEDGYGWHISDLKIYDTPKELGEFYSRPAGACAKCVYPATYDTDHNAARVPLFPLVCANRCERTPKITRPPQSWQYCYDWGKIAKVRSECAEEFLQDLYNHAKQGAQDDNRAKILAQAKECGDGD